MRPLLPFCVLAGLMLGTAMPPPSGTPAVPVRLYAAVEPFAADAPSPSPLPPMAVPPGEPVPAPPPLARSRPAAPPAAPLAALPVDGPVRIVVSLSQQKAFVYKAGALLA